MSREPRKTFERLARLAAPVAVVSFLLSACNEAPARGNLEDFDLQTHLMRRSGVSVRPAEQIYMLRKLALSGDPGSMCELASRLYTGNAVAPDVGGAVDLWLEAAKHDRADAEFCLAVLYSRGQSVPLSRLQAYKWLLLAQASGGAYANTASSFLQQIEKAPDHDLLDEARRLAGISNENSAPTGIERKPANNHAEPGRD